MVKEARLSPKKSWLLVENRFRDPCPACWSNTGVQSTGSFIWTVSYAGHYQAASSKSVMSHNDHVSDESFNREKFEKHQPRCIRAPAFAGAFSISSEVRKLVAGRSTPVLS